MYQNLSGQGGIGLVKHYKTRRRRRVQYDTRVGNARRVRKTTEICRRPFSGRNNLSWCIMYVQSDYNIMFIE